MRELHKAYKLRRLSHISNTSKKFSNVAFVYWPLLLGKHRCLCANIGVMWRLICHHSIFQMRYIFQGMPEVMTTSTSLTSSRTPQIRSRNYWVATIKKPNQMANRTLNFEAGNGNWWRRCNHKRKLLIGSEHTFHWIHWHTSCSLAGKIGWKAVGNY